MLMTQNYKKKLVDSMKDIFKLVLFEIYRLPLDENFVILFLNEIIF